MREWYSDKIRQYFRAIEPHLGGEIVKHRFIGMYAVKSAFKSYGGEGLWVATDKALYFYGRAKGIYFGTGLATGKELFSAHGKVLVFSFDKMINFEHKRDRFFVEYDVSTQGAEYKKNVKKFRIRMYLGKEGKEKETKVKLLSRAAEFNQYVQSCLKR